MAPEYFKPGSEVLVGGLVGTVTVVQILSGLMYKVSWWAASEKKSEWFEEFEVFPTDNSVKTSIGFKS